MSDARRSAGAAGVQVCDKPIVKAYWRGANLDAYKAASMALTGVLQLPQ